MTVCWEVVCSFLFEVSSRSRSRLAVTKGLTNALNLSPKGRGERILLDKREGLPVVHPVRCWLQTHKSFANYGLYSCTNRTVE